MKKSLTLIATFITVSAFSQEKYSLLPSFNVSPVVQFTEEEQLNQPTLQDLIESLYITSVSVLEDGKLNYKKGDFPVAIAYKKSKQTKYIKSKEINLIDINKIANFKYQKGDTEAALFGSNGAITGMIYIEIDE